MAWIELHTSLRNHPKIIVLASELGISKIQAIGHVVCLWTWALEYVEDGDLSKYTPEIIESACEWNGQKGSLYNELIGKFVDKDHFIHDWYDYAGRYLTAKYRTHGSLKLVEIKRKYESRKGQTKVRPRSVKGPSKVVLPNQPNLTIPNQPNLTIPSQIDHGLFLAFKEKRKEMKKPLTGKAEELAIEKLMKFYATGDDPNEVLKESIQNSWQGLFPLKKNGTFQKKEQPYYKRQSGLDEWAEEKQKEMDHDKK